MAQDDIVRDMGGREYLLGPFLKAGLIGAVYPAISMDEERERVAVKLPAPNLNAEQRQRFWQESEVLADLANKLEEPRPIPWIKKGISNRGEGKALIMEFVGEDRLLSSQLPSADTQPWEREGMALRAAEQYARLLETLHGLNYTCQDRKLTDLRWTDESGGRLVVLDWNVVQEGAEGRVDDLYLFGVLWYQLLAGRYPLANLNPLDDKLWRDGAVSYGTRRLFAKILLPTVSKRFQTAIDLRKALQEQLDLVRRDPADVLAEARQLFGDVTNTNRIIEQARHRTDGGQGNIPLPDLDKEWQVLELFDLAYRKANAPQKEALSAELQSAEELVRRQSERLVSGTQQAFRLTQYDQGQHEAELASKASQIADERGNPHLKLRIARWNLLIQAGQTVITEGLGLREMRDKLADWVQDVEAAVGQIGTTEATTWQARGKQLRNLLKAEVPSTSRTFKLLAQLVAETEVWAVVRHVERLQFEGQYQEAAERLPQATMKLEAITWQPYQEALRAVLQVTLSQPNLIEWQRALADKAQAQRDLKTWDTEIGRYLDYLRNVRLPDMRTRIESIDPVRFNATKARLREMKRLEEAWQQARENPDNPELWQIVVRQAFPLWANTENEVAERNYAGKAILEAKGWARQYEDTGLLAGDQFALPILEELKTLRLKLTKFTRVDGANYD